MSEVFSNFLGNIPLCLSEILFVILISKNRLRKSITFTIIVIIIMSLMHTLIVFNTTGILITIFTFLFYIYANKLLFDVNIKKNIFLIIIYAIMLLIPDMLSLLICTKLLGMTKEYCYEIFAGSFLSNLMVSTLMILITIIFRTLLDQLMKLKLENNKRIIVISGVTLLSVGFIFFQFINSYEFSNNILIYVLIISFFIIVLINLIRERIENDNMKERYDKLLEFMATYEKEVEEQRILKHENDNNLITIKSKIIDKDNEKEIVSYIDELLNVNTKFKHQKYAKFGYLPPNGLKGLFYYKTDEAEQKGIKVSINISKDINKSVISNLDAKHFKLLGNIVGVFLDNAIEASLNSNDKKMGIEIYKNKKNVEILISNSYSNKVDTKKLGFISYSTKGKKRGHGLLLVNSIVRSNKIFENEKIITDNLFTQKLIVKKLD